MSLSADRRWRAYTDSIRQGTRETQEKARSKLTARGASLANLADAFVLSSLQR